MDLLTLALSRKYTDDSLDGAGALKGAPCTVEDISKVGGITTVTLGWTTSSGTHLTQDLTINDGEDGEDGAQGPQGETGATGPQGPQGETGATGAKGDKGNTGTTFTPSVSAEGVISWTNDGGAQNPESVSIKGPKGDKGDTGDAGTIATTVVPGIVKPDGSTITIDPDGTIHGADPAAGTIADVTAIINGTWEDN